MRKRTIRQRASSLPSEQGEYILEWKAYVQKAIDQGMPKEEAIEKLTAMTDRYPMDVGLEGQAPRVMRMNVANLYDYLTRAGMHAGRAQPAVS